MACRLPARKQQGVRAQVFNSMPDGTGNYPGAPGARRRHSLVDHAPAAAAGAPPRFRVHGPAQVFNNTPDETAFFRLCLERADVTASLTMIQPPLLAYGLETPPQPVLLDVASLKPDAVLLLDCWFYIVVHAGASIAAWRGAGYQDQPEHAAFRRACPEDEGLHHSTCDSTAQLPEHAWQGQLDEQREPLGALRRERGQPMPSQGSRACWDPVAGAGGCSRLRRCTACACRLAVQQPAVSGSRILSWAPQSGTRVPPRWLTLHCSTAQHLTETVWCGELMACSACRALLEQPVAEARALARSRLPTPRIIECDAGGSQVRVRFRNIREGFRVQEHQRVAEGRAVPVLATHN